MTDKIKNLCLRTATGIAFVAVLVGGILWSNVTFTLLFAVVTGLSVREFCQVVNRRADVQTNAVICTVAALPIWNLPLFGRFGLLQQPYPFRGIHPVSAISGVPVGQ